MLKEAAANEFFHVDSMWDEPDVEESHNEFLHCEPVPEGCICGKAVDNKPYYGGDLYKSIVNEFDTLGATESMSRDSVYINALKGDLYCIGLYYNHYFSINDEPGEGINEMIQLLRFGMWAGFWLSYFQSSLFIDDLRSSKFSGLFAFEKESRFNLIKLARDKFTELHPLLSNMSKEDIEKQIMLMIFEDEDSINLNS